jgi:hypothetical protein
VDARDDESVSELLAMLRRLDGGRGPELREVGTAIGETPVRIYASSAALDRLMKAARTLPAALERLREERDRLSERVETLEHEVERRRTSDAPASVARRKPREQPSSLASVPLALVAPFRPTPQTLKAAKDDPLLALAVQATAAMQPDASELDRARLNAMAFAASRRDMKAFWAARQGRSAAKLNRTRR